MKLTKRFVSKINGGVTFGDQPPQIKIYEGRTSHDRIKGSSRHGTDEDVSRESAKLPQSNFSDEEETLLENVSRGERI